MQVPKEMKTALEKAIEKKQRAQDEKKFRHYAENGLTQAEVSPTK
jgi:hypothetical protein